MTNPSKIVKLFSQKLESLYSDPSGFNKDWADALLSSITFLVVPSVLKDMMEAKITTEEVAQFIKLLKTLKRPGPDGYSAGFY